MQIVIDIDERVYCLLKYFEKALGFNDKKDDNDDVKTALMRAVINGTQLPKGHGRLIDAGEYENSIRKHYFDNSTVIRCTEIALNHAPTIIEADRAESEDKE